MTHITLSNITPRADYTVSSTPQSAFSVPFAIFDPSTDLTVYVGGSLATYSASPSGSSQFSFSGSAVDGGYSSGTITLGSSVSSTTVSVIRAVPSTRTEDFPYPSSTLNIQALNTSLDRFVAIGQQLVEGIKRAIRLGDTEADGATLTLPSAASRANLGLKFDGSGNLTTTAADPDTSQAAAAASASAAATSASNASSSASSAATSASNAATSASNASTSASSASASAAAAAASAGSGLFGTLSNKSADFTVTADTDNATLFIVDTSGGSVTVTLPSIATAGEGERYGFMRTSAANSLIISRNGSDTINGAASNYTLPAVAGEVTVILADEATPDNWILLPWTQAGADEDTLTKSGSTIAISTKYKKETIALACSDETTALTTGTGKIAFRMPYAFTVTAVRASLTTAQTSGSIFTVDINESGTSIISTKLTIDNTEKTSTTAATAAVISDSALADDAEITVDIDQVGDGTAKGLKVYLIGYKA